MMRHAACTYSCTVCVNQTVVNVTYIYNVSLGISSPEQVPLRTVFPDLLVAGCYTSAFFFFLISHSIDTQTTRTTLTYHRQLQRIMRLGFQNLYSHYTFELC